MHAIIVGAGKFGSRIAKHMVREDWDVVIIEKDEELGEEITEKLGVLVIHGDGTKVDLLKEAEIDKADVFVAATGVEEVNILSALLAKDLNVGKVIARIGNPEYQKILERFKVDYVLLPEITAADYVFDIVIKSSAESVQDFTIHGGKILSLKIGERFHIVGKKVKDIKLDPENAMIIGIKREDSGELLIPFENDVIAEEDVLYIISKEEYLEKLPKIIK
uniref:Trk system potassium uptake protein (TrkA) n=1 Tax=uncultured marine group II/III euryarchaeote KM3_195_B08 TaxID=1457970 RepID=A0A075GY69_9EURY|nr:trk system potassium uptake protein (trkA) [uncultured marine group II/III euryarchaeote KM3_195_B08]